MEINKPVEHGDFYDYFFQLIGPYFGNTLQVTEKCIVFDGYFRYESELLQEDRPVHRLMDFQGHTYLLAFIGKRTGKNTSVYWDDEEEGGKICLSPTEIIELDYRVVEKDPPKERWEQIMRMIHEEDKHLREVNLEIHGQRVEREWAAYKRGLLENNTTQK